MRMTGGIELDGLVGAAGFGEGTAAVRVTPVEGGMLLDYDVNSRTGGKPAQIDSRRMELLAR